MQTSSANYKTAIAATDREIRGYLEFNNTFTLDGAGGLISFKTTQNAMDAERFCAGSVTSCFCEATFFNSGLSGSGVSLANSYFDAYIGVNTTIGDETSTEYVCCGRYYVSEITRGKETTSIVGYDIAGRLSMDYVPTVTASASGYLVMDILNDIIDQTGVNGGTHFTTYGDNTYVSEIYEGNCRAQWGWLCSLVDEEAVSYSGTRDSADLGYMKKYVAGNGEANPYAIGETAIYMDGASFGDEFTITSFTTGTTDTPIVIGNGTGIYGLNPYMDSTTATTIEGTMDNYSYYPATLHWRGDPCLDILDEINVTQGTDTYKIVAMKIETTFNGGLEQTIYCYGDSEEYYALSTSPTQGQINRVSNLVQEIQQAIETADGGVITKILDTDGTWKELVIANNQDLSQATSVWRFNINGLAHSNRYSGGTYTLAMDTQGRIVANVIQTGILQDAAGKNSWNLDTGAFTITDGSINITTNSVDLDVITLCYSNTTSGDVETSLMPYGFTSTQTNGFANTRTDVNYVGVAVMRPGTTPGSYYTVASMNAGGVILGSSPSAVQGGVATDGYLNIYDSSGVMRESHSGTDGSISFYDASAVCRQMIDGNGTLYQYDANGKKRTYLEYGDAFFYDSSETLRTQVHSDSRVSFYDSSGVKQGQVGLSSSVAWYKGRDGAMARNSRQPASTGDYMPALSTKAYSSDWSIGTRNNDLYFINTMDSNYSSSTNRVTRYKLAYADSSGSFLTPDILTTLNTTDRVIAQGTSGSWTYRKWASGAYECWQRRSVSVAISSAWGQSYYGVLSTLTYPVTFSSAPFEQVSVVGGNGWAWIGGHSSSPTTTASAEYILMRGASASSTSYNIDYYVRGTV